MTAEMMDKIARDLNMALLMRDGAPMTKIKDALLAVEATSAQEAVSASLTSLVETFRALAKDHQDETGRMAPGGEGYWINRGMMDAYRNAAALVEARLKGGQP